MFRKRTHLILTLCLILLLSVVSIAQAAPPWQEDSQDNTSLRETLDPDEDEDVDDDEDEDVDDDEDEDEDDEGPGAKAQLHPVADRLARHFGKSYEDIKALSNPADLVMAPGTPVLGSDDGLGFGWKNQNVYKFGVRYKYSPDLTFRAGYSHGSQVVPSDQALFNVLAPAVVQDHFTFGVSKTLASNNEIHFSLMYSPEEEVHGQNPNTGPQTGHLYMSQWDIEIGWVFKL